MAQDPTRVAATDEMDLEKLRTILFGAHREDVDRRFESVDAALAGEARGIRSDLTSVGDELRGAIREEKRRLDESLSREVAAQNQARETLSSRVTQLAEEMNRRFTTLEKKLDASLHDLGVRLTQALEDRTAGMESHWKAELSRLSGRTDQSLTRLREAATDRANLATLLRDMAGRIEPGPDGASGPGNENEKDR